MRLIGLKWDLVYQQAKRFSIGLETEKLMKITRMS